MDHGRDLTAFIAFPYRLFRHDPHWVPELRHAAWTRLSPKKNPFFEHAAVRHFLARRDGRVVGRISAIQNRLHNEFHHDTVGFFGFFECIEDQSVADGLFEAAGAWLLERGLTVMRGPASFSTNDECGLLVDGLTERPTVMTPHNPPYYGALVERAGFTPVKNLLMYQSTDDRLPAKLVRGSSVIADRYGVTIRPLELKRFDDEVEVVKKLYNVAWERNWGFVPMTDREIDHMAKEFRPVVVPDLVAFAEVAGDPVGFALALPDLNVALKANPSGRFFPGILKILWASRRIDRIRVLLLGTTPDWQGKGVDALLYKQIWERAYARGYRWAEAGWILEDNMPMRNAAKRMGFEAYKTYRLYDRSL